MVFLPNLDKTILWFSDYDEVKEHIIFKKIA